MTADLASLVTTHRILVCVGSGGVGKTTTAAALALWGALQGRHTAVVTIDPAKRLADCLGLRTGNEQEQPLPAEAFAPYGLTPSGTLTALLVEQQSAWNAVIERYVPTAELRERILTNRFYQGLSQTFAGSHEYMALDTLARLAQRGAYDLIVVDTPPTRQALDFLEAPRRLQRLLDHPMSKRFIRPSVTTGWAAFSLVNRTTTFLLQKIEEATGISTLGEIAEFFTIMERMLEDFSTRFARVSELLASPETAFVLVTSPEEAVLAEAEELHVGLERLSVNLKAVVVNRVHEEWSSKGPSRISKHTLIQRLRKTIHLPSNNAAHLPWLADNFLAYQTLARGEWRRLAHFCRGLPPNALPPQCVPALPTLPVDLGGLVTFQSYLFKSA